MFRYLRLYAYFLRFSFSKAMEFRLDFYFRIIMDVLYYIVNIAFFKLIMMHTPYLGGWSEPQLMIFISGYLFVDAVNMTLFSNNMWVLPQMINKGDLDYYLLRPVSSLFFVSTRDFSVSSFINLLMTFGIMAWSIAHFPEPFGPLKIGAYFVFLVLGTVIYYIVQFLSLAVAFWTHSPRGLHTLFWPFARVMERPDRIFRGWVRFVFVTVLPFALMASFPARLVLDPLDWTVLAHLMAVTVVFFCILLWVWNKGLESYSSASS